ncbi:MAG: methyltransferase family protein [Promethearchaeota archaeon]
MKPIHVIRKIGFPTLWYVVYYNIWFILLSPDIYSDIGHIAIILMYIVAYIDSFSRPFSEKEEIANKYSLLLMIGFLINPFIFILAYIENQLLIKDYFPIWNNIIVFVIGIIFIIIGGIIQVFSRIQLGKYGSGMLVIEDDHQLVTRGIYRYIRHPIYLGGAMVGFGTELAFRSLIVPLLGIFYSFLLIKPRMDQEEKILSEEFSDEYKSYIKRTRRLLPFIY